VRFDLDEKDGVPGLAPNACRGQELAPWMPSNRRIRRLSRGSACDRHPTTTEIIGLWDFWYQNWRLELRRLLGSHIAIIDLRTIG
jgi:hypothetical protein